jgi:cell wall-associated NlpC family hydrolase
MHRINTYKTRLYKTLEDSLDDRFSSYGTELIYGECFDVKDIKGEWAHGISVKDRYEGWVKLSDLHIDTKNPKTQKAIIGVKEALVFKSPHLKAVVINQVPFCAIVNIGQEQDGYLYCPELEGWLFKQHVICADNQSAPQNLQTLIDLIIDTAFIFNGCPYLYGGCTSRGIDCSALIKLSLQFHGIAIPRDSGPQKQFLEDKTINEVFSSIAPEAKIENLQKGDIAFFPGHVGIMFDDEHLLHASGAMMKVCVQPVAQVNGYYKQKEGQGLTAIRRFQSA